jgi:hypothetical protein
MKAFTRDTLKEGELMGKYANYDKTENVIFMDVIGRTTSNNQICKMRLCPLIAR